MDNLQYGTYHNPPATVTFQELVRIVWRRKWSIFLLIAISVGTAAYLTTHLQRRWQASAQIILIQRAPNSHSSHDTFLTPLVETPETQVALIESTTMAQKTLDLLKNRARARHQSHYSPGITVDQLRRDISVVIPKDTNLLTVTLEASTRDQAIELADAVCDAFVKWKREVAQQSYQEAMNSLDVRASRANEQLLEAEQRVQAFKRNRNLVDVPLQQTAVLQQYLDEDKALTSIQADQAVQKERLRLLESRLSAENAAIRSATGVRDDSQVIKLQADLEHLEMERATAALKYTAEYPGILPDLDSQIKDVQNRLAAALQGTLDQRRPSLQSQGALQAEYIQQSVIVRVGEAKIRAAASLRDRAKQSMASVPKDSLTFARLSRDETLARDLSTSLQSQLSTARIEKDMTTSNVQIAEYATSPLAPFRPNHLATMLTGLAVGLALAIVAVFILEHSDRRVFYVESVRNLLGGPVIGRLPTLNWTQRVALLRGEENNLASEAFSIFRVNLKAALGHSHSPPHAVYLVTSTLPGEGKSTIAASLARSLASPGKEVILVDADMRQERSSRPSKRLVAGLADVLEGRIDSEDALMKSDTENLRVLYSGNLTTNPTELLSSAQMSELVDFLKRNATVVIDTPASGAVADALLIAPLADCVVYVVGLSHVDTPTLWEAVAAIRQSCEAVVTFFVNYDSDVSIRPYPAYRSSRNRAISALLPPTVND